ncbi:MAG TPA: acyltransferase [Candidatus Acidoferrales bacterium]|nr:acyltransferase [Candidatus Acidoferrales bacterium]
MNLIRRVHGAWNGTLSFFRLLLPRCAGLQTGFGVHVGGGIEWPLGNVCNMHVGDRVSLGKRGWFYLPLHNRQAKIRIGSGTAVGNDFVITSNELIDIGSDCLLSYRVTVMDHSHVTGPGVAPTTSGLTPGQSISIGDRCFIGCNVVIMPSVKLGANCVVGANSVVTKSFDAGSVIAGAPARLLRQIGSTPTPVKA